MRPPTHLAGYGWGAGWAGGLGAGGRQAEDLASGLPYLARPLTLTPSGSAAPTQGETNRLTPGLRLRPGGPNVNAPQVSAGAQPTVAEPDTAVLRTLGTQLLVLLPRPRSSEAKGLCSSLTLSFSSVLKCC